MSDVLIKGTRFKKPKSCFTHGGVYCPFHVESFNGKYHACTLTGSEVKCNRLSKDCPLVEVKPHGRLIDADKLLPESGYDPMMFKPKYGGDHRTQYNTLMGYEILGMVNEAPTVLEASNVF